MAYDLSSWPRILMAAAFAGAVLAPATITATVVPAIAAEKAVAPEKNPPGDIPDTQVFIDYTSNSGFTLKVPEGWARTDRPDGASFIDKLDGVIVTESAAAAAPTIDSVKGQYIANLAMHVRAMKLGKVEAVKLPAGDAIRIAFSSNSDPNPVTNKQVRLESEIYLYHANGRQVSVELYAPYGADNVDQWRLMSRSFRWK